MGATYRYMDFTFDVRLFALSLRTMQTLRNLTIDEIAEMTGMSANTVVRYMSGTEDNMKIQSFLVFCNLFDLDPRNYFTF